MLWGTKIQTQCLRLRDRKYLFPPGSDLHVQGGRTATVAGDSSGKSISFPITFSEAPAFLATLGQPSTLPNTYGIITNVSATTAVVWVVNDNTWRSATVRWAAFGS